MSHPISITLNFISLEAAHQVLQAVPASALFTPGAAVPAAEQPKAQEPEAKKSAKAQKADASSPATAKENAAPTQTAEEQAPAAASAATDAPASTAVTPAEVDYPTLQKAVFALAGKSREAATAVAAALGVKTFKELQPDQWAGALEAVNAKLAELEAA